jgi:acetyl/propionyl-CoA carboxylase alpha subunit
MLGKLIVWGPTRDEAIARMVRALQELNVSGVRTGAPAALSVLEDERFRRGEFDTHFLESLDIEGRGAQYDELVAVAAAIFRHHRSRRRALSTSSAERAAWLDRSRRALSSHSRRAGQRSAQDGASA